MIPQSDSVNSPSLSTHLFAMTIAVTMARLFRSIHVISERKKLSRNQGSYCLQKIRIQSLESKSRHHLYPPHYPHSPSRPRHPYHPDRPNRPSPPSPPSRLSRLSPPSLPHPQSLSLKNPQLSQLLVPMLLPISAINQGLNSSLCPFPLSRRNCRPSLRTMRRPVLSQIQIYL